MFHFIRSVDESSSILLEEDGLHSPKEEESPGECDTDLSEEAMQRYVMKKVVCSRITFYLVIICALAQPEADQGKRVTRGS